MRLEIRKGSKAGERKLGMNDITKKSIDKEWIKH